MKIGIITFHRALSFGANLQCYALQETLMNLGYEVCVLDYRQPYLEQHYKPLQFNVLCKYLFHPKSFFRYIMGFRQRNNILNSFRLFQKQAYNVEYFDGKELPAEIDIALIGSDQMWSTNYTGGVDTCYFGNIEHLNNQKIAAYAISANLKSLSDIKQNILKQYVNNFSLLSFREEAIAQYIYNVTEADYKICLDPVLLTNENTWSKICKQEWTEKNYIAVFQVHPVENDFCVAINYARRIAKKLECKIIDVNALNIGPAEFVTIIKNARFVVTTSFHGTVFSIIFKKDFVTLSVNDSVDARAKSILNSLNLSNRLCSPQVLNYSGIKNYDNISNKLTLLKNGSIEYLNKMKDL